MADYVYYFILAVAMVIMIILVPKVLRLRIRVLHYLRLTRLANWHDRNFDRLIVIARIVMAVIAAVLLVIGIAKVWGTASPV